MPTIVGTFRAAGGVIGVDNRGRLAGIDLLAGESIREVQFQVRLRTGLVGASAPAPPTFFDLVAGVAFGLDAASPPDFDPKTNAAGWDWLAVRFGTNIILPRPTTTTNNGWELECHAQTDGWVPCPRPAVTVTTSIWLVCNPIPQPAPGAPPYALDCWLGYRTTT